MRILFTLSAIALASCATADKRRVVTVAEPTLTEIQTVNYVNPEARAACDTRQMRRRALDNNLQNDMASITVVREVVTGTRMLTDIEVNCREYFSERLRSDALENAHNMPNLAMSGRTVADPMIISGPAIENPSTMSTYIRSAPSTHTVAVGDTLTAIARRHCVSVAGIRAINGMTVQTQIYAEDVLRLPSNSC